MTTTTRPQHLSNPVQKPLESEKLWKLYLIVSQLCFHHELIVNFVTGTFDTDEMFYGHRDEPYPADTRVDSDSDELCGGRWPQTTQYVYDAAAERTQQRIRRGRVSTLVDGVH